MKEISEKKNFKNRYFEMWLENEVVFINYFSGTVVDLEAAEIILKDRLDFQEGKSYPIFVNVLGVRYWTREARTFQASEKNHEGVKAFAMLIDSHVAKTVIKFYLHFNKPLTPTDCFTSKEKALKWLAQFD